MYTRYKTSKNIQVVSWNVGSNRDKHFDKLSKYARDVPLVGPDITTYITKITSDTYPIKGIYLFQELQIKTHFKRLILEMEYTKLGDPSIHGNYNAISYTHHFREFKKPISASYDIKFTGIRSTKWHFLKDDINKYAVISIHLHIPLGSHKNKLRSIYEAKKILDDAKIYKNKNYIIIIGGDFNTTIQRLNQKIGKLILKQPYLNTIYKDEFTPKYSIYQHIKKLNFNISKNVIDAIEDNKPYHISAIGEESSGQRFHNRVDYIITNAIIKSEKIEGISNQYKPLHKRYMTPSFINKKCSYMLTKYNNLSKEKYTKTKCSHDHAKVSIII